MQAHRQPAPAVEDSTLEPTTGGLTRQCHRFLDELVKLDDVDLAVDILMSRRIPSAVHAAPEEPETYSSHTTDGRPSAYHTIRSKERDECPLVSPPFHSYSGDAHGTSEMLDVEPAIVAGVRPATSTLPTPEDQRAWSGTASCSEATSVFDTPAASISSVDAVPPGHVVESALSLASTHTHSPMDDCRGSALIPDTELVHDLHAKAAEQGIQSTVSSRGGTVTPDAKQLSTECYVRPVDTTPPVHQQAPSNTATTGGQATPSSSSCGMYQSQTPDAANGKRPSHWSRLVGAFSSCLCACGSASDKQCMHPRGNVQMMPPTSSMSDISLPGNSSPAGLHALASIDGQTCSSLSEASSNTNCAYTPPWYPGQVWTGKDINASPRGNPHGVVATELSADQLCPMTATGMRTESQSKGAGPVSVARAESLNGPIPHDVVCPAWEVAKQPWDVVGEEQRTNDCPQLPWCPPGATLQAQLIRADLKQETKWAVHLPTSHSRKVSNEPCEFSPRLVTKLMPLRKRIDMSQARIEAYIQARQQKSWV
eukprot:jgi/Ulvmu1/9236/UM005_0336.1